MNKKIYFHTNFILLTGESIQPSENQLIVNDDLENAATLKIYLENFIQQTDQKNLILVVKDVNNTFERIKKEFTFIEAAGGLIRNKDKFLFIYRLGKWDLPKGKLEISEEPAEAAVRECEEECGIRGLELVNELPSTYHIYPYKENYALKITYWYVMRTDFNGALIPQTQEHIEKAEWLDINTIKDTVLPNSYPSVIDVIKAGITEVAW
jgi:8-oxo-dGTP pyrophosphatase MutT (NUDIX family)